MTEKIKYSIITPTFNERENIVILLERLEALFEDQFEIIVADENSPDGTAEAVEQYGKDKNYIHCVLNDGEPGLSPSVIKGFDQAKGEYLACIDGDLQHDEKALPGIFSELENAAMVIGSRYVDGGGFDYKWNPVRVLVSNSAAIMTRLLLNIKVKDPMSGCFAIKNETYREVRGKLNPKGYKIMLEILYRLKQYRKDCRIIEKGLTFRKRIHGQSKLNFKIIIQFLLMLFELKFSKKEK